MMFALHSCRKQIVPWVLGFIFFIEFLACELKKSDAGVKSR